MRASLEQAQLLFEAAESLPTASRPLCLFEGLSQAGRAIAAARAGDDWRLGSGGLACDGVDGGLDELELADDTIGAFTKLAATLGSPSVLRPVRLRSLAAALPHAVSHSLADVDDVSAALVEPELSERPLSSLIDPVVSAWIWGLPSSIFSGEDARRSVASYLDRFPGASGSRFAPGTGEELELARATDGSYGVRVQWIASSAGETLSEEDRDDVLRQATFQAYDSSLWLIPELAGGGDAMSPFVIWWAVLFGLATLATTAPAVWRQALDVDDSPDAVPVEELLDHALCECPFLMLHELQASATPRSFRS